MIEKFFGTVLAALTVLSFIIVVCAAEETTETHAPLRQTEWENPSAQMRPLRIVHGQKIDELQAERNRNEYGLGGLVMNVPFENGYLRNDANWKSFVESVRAAREGGLRVWIYDEQGWPSLSAGGVVLEQDPSLECLELVHDPEAAEPFYSRKSYEYTFASMDTLRTARRHPNPLDPNAARKFLEVTHQHYCDALGPELYAQVEAFFTDEPTLLGISLLRILMPEEREKYGVTDPLDWSKKQLPAIPWRADLEERYKEKYGEELRPNFKSLFGGDAETDRAVRGRFWKLVGELNAESYFGEIRRFCENHPNGPKASGHTLAEESFLLNVPLDGNKLEVLKQFQIPGQDLLTSVPRNQFESNWLTSVFPASAAYLIGERKIMTEISDHIERHAAPPHIATLDEMRSAAGIMAANGITEFTLYYSVSGGEEFPYRTPETYRTYCGFVGRLNAVLRDAQPVRPVLLYYPIEVVQEEYLPMAGQFRSDSQSRRIQEISHAFNALGKALTQAQIPFILVDDQSIRELIANGAGAEKTGRTVRSDLEFSEILYPAGVEKKNYAWNNRLLKEIYVENVPGRTTLEFVQTYAQEDAGPRLKLDPPNPNVALGSFIRDGKFVFVLACASENGYEGNVTFRASASMGLGGKVPLFDGKGGMYWPDSRPWTLLHPESGAIETIDSDDGTLHVKLNEYQTILLAAP